MYGVRYSKNNIMDRRSFLQRFGLGVGAVLIAPKIITSSIIKPDNEIITASRGSALLGNEIFFRVINNNPHPSEVMLFGINKNLNGNFIPEGIKIFVAGTTIEKIHEAIMYAPVRIMGLKIRVTNLKQLSNPINLYDERKDGRISRVIFQPLNYRSAMNEDIRMIDCPGFELLLTPSIYVMNMINPGEQVDYIFTIDSPYNVIRTKPLIMHS